MAQRQVVEIACTRCDRKEYREPPPPDPMAKEDEESRTPAFVAQLYMGGPLVEVSFDDLCTPCANTIRGHLGQIAKKIEGVSPMRGKREKHPLQELSDKKTQERAAKATTNGAKKEGHASA